VVFDRRDVGSCDLGVTDDDAIARDERHAAVSVATKFLGDRLPVRAGGNRLDLSTDELRAYAEVLRHSLFDRGAKLTGHVEVEHRDGDGDDSERERK
jgi:hypothetical protein